MERYMNKGVLIGVGVGVGDPEERPEEAPYMTTMIIKEIKRFT